MTPKEFKTLKRGDKVILDKDKCVMPDHHLYGDKDVILEVAGIHLSLGTVLLFTENGWGEKINEGGWDEAYKLPKSDVGKWALSYTFVSLSIYSPKNVLPVITSGKKCVICNEYNLWAENNYPAENPKIYACFSCRSSRQYMLINHFKRKIS